MSDQVRAWSEEQRTVVQMLGLLVLAAAFAIFPIRRPTEPVPMYEGQPSPLGYTWSLALFLFPLMRLWVWLYQRDDLVLARKAAKWALIGILPIWCALDFLLGLTFFAFPNTGAHLGWTLPGWEPGRGWVRELPIEEFVFYGSGIALIQLAYVWASESWLSHYRHTDDERRAHGQAPIVRIDWRLLGGALLAIPVALLYKKLGPHEAQQGVPGYFYFLLVSTLAPVVLYIQAIRPYVNWQAFSFATFGLMVLYLLWEGTLAMPYGYWRYRESQMMGIFIKPWGGLPIEAVLLWLGAGWLNLSTYEALRLLYANDRPYRDLFRTRRAA